MEYLTTHFTFEELVRSQTATRLGIDNTPDQASRDNLFMLAKNILEPIRSLIGYAIHIDSGYRCQKLNDAIGGSHSSQHMKGQAADITINSMSTEALYSAIKFSNIPFDQLIQEFDQWVHVSYSDNPRREALRAVKENGKTVYTKDWPK